MQSVHSVHYIHYMNYMHHIHGTRHWLEQSMHSTHAIHTLHALHACPNLQLFHALHLFHACRHHMQRIPYTQCVVVRQIGRLRWIWLGGIASDWKRVDLCLHTALDEYLGMATNFWLSGRLEELKSKLLLKVATVADLAATNLRTARSDSIVEDLGRWGAMRCALVVWTNVVLSKCEFHFENLLL